MHDEDPAEAGPVTVVDSTAVGPAEDLPPVPVGAPPAPDRPTVHRLRRLDRRSRVLAAVAVLLLLVPFGASLGRAVRVEWLPSGDDALIGLRAHDVLDGHPPLVGQPSTSHLYGPEEGTAHPGPIEFYWLALPVRLLGPTAGMLLGIAAVNLASVLLAAWVVLRRAGPGVAAWSALLLSGVLWSEGTALLTDPISSNAGGLPLLALFATGWAVVDGDWRLLPLATLLGSWVAQQHLAIVAPSASLVGWVGVAVAAGLAALAWRRRPSADDVGLAARLAPDRPVVPWLAAAVVVAAVCWAPVAWQELTHDRGNVSAVLEYARESEQPTLGERDALRQVVRALGAPPLLVRSDLGGADLYAGPLGGAEVAVASLMVAALVAGLVVGVRSRRSLATLAATTLVLCAGGLVNGSSIPRSIEAFRINFYRWTFVVAWAAWLVVGWLVGLALVADRRRRGRPTPTPLGRWAAVAAVVLMVVPAVAGIATAGTDDRRRDQPGFPAMRAMSAAALDAAGSADTVTLVLRGRSSVLASGPALTLQLATAGHEVTLPGQEGRFYGQHRVLEPGDDPGEVILLLTTARGALPDGPGEVVATYDMNEEVNALLGSLLARVEAGEVRVADDGPALVAQRWPDEAARAYVTEALSALETEPAAVLANPALLDVVAAGYFAEPAFPAEDLDRLRAALPAATVNDDDLFELRVLTPEELLDVRPDLAEDG